MIEVEAGIQRRDANQARAETATIRPEARRSGNWPTTNDAGARRDRNRTATGALHVGNELTCLPSGREQSRT